MNLVNAASLAAAAAVLVLVALLCPLLDSRSPQERDLELLLEVIESVGGKIGRDEKVPEQPIVSIDVTGHTPLVDAALELFTGLPELRALSLQGNVTITDAGLDSLTAMTQLQRVNLRGTRITRAGAERLNRALPAATLVTDWGPPDEGP